MTHNTTVAPAGIAIPSIPVAKIAPWATFFGLLALLALYFVSTPPAVGSGDTIGQRTALYFTFLLVSVGPAAACAVLASRLLDSRGVQSAVLTALWVTATIVLAAFIRRLHTDAAKAQARRESAASL